MRSLDGVDYASLGINDLAGLAVCSRSTRQAFWGYLEATVPLAVRSVRPGSSPSSMVALLHSLSALLLFWGGIFRARFALP